MTDNTFVRWFLAPAFWWQFWMPQSGLAGGLIFAAVVYFPIVLLCLMS